jgi:isopenicillin N synthase-like dioxygenase
MTENSLIIGDLSTSNPNSLSGEPGRRALVSIPCVDVSPFIQNGSDHERRRVADEIHDACVNIGFFYIEGHGIPTTELNASLNLSQQFFSLPPEKKLAVTAKQSLAKMGYIQVGGVDPKANAVTRPDIKERFYFGRDLFAGEAEDLASPAGQSQWPASDVLPGFEIAMREQTTKKVVLAKSLARAFSLSLGLEENFFDGFYDHMGVMHALNYYARREPQAAQDAAFGFSPHTDYGSFTIVLQDTNGGLQARNSDGVWIDVPPVPGTFVVNVGDLLQRWTNDIYISSLHRVVNMGTGARSSISFFVYPNPRAEIHCLETCVSESRPQRYKSVLSGEYVNELVVRAHNSGQPGLSERTADRIRT